MEGKKREARAQPQPQWPPSAVFAHSGRDHEACEQLSSPTHRVLPPCSHRLLRSLPRQTWALVVTKRTYIFTYIYLPAQQSRVYLRPNVHATLHTLPAYETNLHCRRPLCPLSLHLNMVRGDFEVKHEQLHAPPALALAGGCLRARRPTLATTRAHSAGLVKALVKMSANCFSVSTPAILR